MANKKYKLANNDYWESSGVYDLAEGKTQREVNASLKGSLNSVATINTIRARNFNDASNTTTRTIAIPSNARFMLAIVSSSLNFCGVYIGLSYSGGSVYIKSILESTGITFDTSVNNRLTINTTDSRAMTYAIWSLSGDNANNYYIV